MASDATRTQGEGALAGALAGIVFGLAQILAAAATGDPAVTPFRGAASLLFGAGGLDDLAAPTAIAVGSLIHLVLSLVFGWAFGLVSAALTADLRRSWFMGAVLGAAYGTLLWLVNFHAVARLAFPWLLALPQGTQWLLHAVFFGVPLGLLLASAERGHARWAARRAVPTG